MPTPVYTNKDLNKPINKGNSKVYTNKDLVQEIHPPDILDDAPDIMDDSPSPPDVLDDEVENTATPIDNNEPDSWWTGFNNSITSGNAFQPLHDTGNYLKGAILDIPKTIGDTFRGIGNKFNEKFNHSLPQSPEELYKQLSSRGPGPMWEEGTNLGLTPDETARTIGQFTGQPLVTEGMIKGIPLAGKMAAPLVEKTGSIMRKYAPLTGMPIISPLAGRNLQKLERFTGKGIEKLGRKMRGSSESSSIAEPVLDNGKELPSSEISGYKVIRNERPLSDIATEFLSKKKKVRVNSDGTFTDMNTGEMFDDKGNSIVEINGKPAEKYNSKIDKNSSFFFKNRSQ